MAEENVPEFVPPADEDTGAQDPAQRIPALIAADDLEGLYSYCRLIDGSFSLLFDNPEWEPYYEEGRQRSRIEVLRKFLADRGSHALYLKLTGDWYGDQRLLGRDAGLQAAFDKGRGIQDVVAQVLQAGNLPFQEDKAEFLNWLAERNFDQETRDALIGWAGHHHFADDFQS